MIDPEGKPIKGKAGDQGPSAGEAGAGQGDVKNSAEIKEDLKGLYDLAIPLGMPMTVIRELVEVFNLEPVKRKAKVDMTGMVTDREITVLRGDLDTVMKAKEHMFQALDRRISEWEKGERGKRYKKYYEQRLAEEAQEKESPSSQDLDQEPIGGR